jgi:hypothetical protein
MASFSSIFENHITSAVLATAKIICYFQFQADFQDLMWLSDNFILYEIKWNNF